MSIFSTIIGQALGPITGLIGRSAERRGVQNKMISTITGG